MSEVPSAEEMVRKLAYSNATLDTKTEWFTDWQRQLEARQRRRAEEAERKLTKATDMLSRTRGWLSEELKGAVDALFDEIKPLSEAAMLQAIPSEGELEGEFDMDCLAEIRALWDRVERAETALEDAQANIIKLGRGEPVG